eukprot:985768-Rhodomonas_salina.1
MLPEEVARYKQAAKDMFYHSYDSYMAHAFPKDELAPISCSGFRWLLLSREGAGADSARDGGSHDTHNCRGSERPPPRAMRAVRRTDAGSGGGKVPADLLRRARHARSARQPHRFTPMLPPMLSYTLSSMLSSMLFAMLSPTLPDHPLS